MSEQTVPGDAIPGTTIRFFLSSTFRDFQIERTVLQQRVFPQLRRLCAASGFRLQPIDLRWGVSEAADTDRQTLRICFDELERCRTLSPDCFLLIQLGERYGSYLLPPQVPATLVERLLPHLTPDEHVAFAAIYRLDTNAVPAEYVLLRADGAHDAADEQLRLALVRAGQVAGVEEAEWLLFDGSATHREIQLGLRGYELPSYTAALGVVCAVRTFAGEQVGPAVASYAAEDAERAERVHHLTDAVLARLPEEQVLRYTVTWEGEAGPVFDEGQLAAAYLGLLQPKLEAVIAARRAARAASEAAGRNAVALANAAFEQERTAWVEGRDAELARLAAYLAGETGASVPLVVTGVGGSGKSTLLAEAAIRAARTHPEAALIVRYCGVTPGADTFARLLTGLRNAIAQAYGEPAPTDDLDEPTLLSTVASDLATRAVPPTRPLLLVVDALDQLSRTTTPTDWLPRQLAPGVRVVVSVLAERPELSTLQSWLPAEQVLTLGSLSVAAGLTLLRDLLMEAPARTLTSEQEAAVLTAFAHEGLPLYLRLVVSVARRWRSFDLPHLGPSPHAASSQQPSLTDRSPSEPARVEALVQTSPSPEESFLPPHASDLPQTVSELLAARLTQLEAPEQYGTALVAHALGDLAAARFGLAEDELLDLLARDQMVRDAQHVLAPASPRIDPNLPFPVALWARLEAELTALLATRRADDGTLLVTFFHRQLREVVEARYLAGAAGVERHRALAAYFAGQPWLLGPKQWNWRKANEEVGQREGADDRSGAEQALEDLAAELEATPSLPADDPVGIVTLVYTLLDRLGTGSYWRVGERLHQQQLVAWRALSDRSGEGTTLSNLGWFAHHLGQMKEARRYYEQALTIEREVGDRRGEAITLHNLGQLASDLGQMEEAQRYYEQALAIFEEVGDRRSEGITLGNLGQLASDLGQPEEARHYYDQSLAIKRQVGDLSDEAVALNSLGTLAYALEQPEEARRYYERAVAIAREVGDRAGEGTMLHNLGALAKHLGQPEEARRYYEQALAIEREVGDRGGEGITLGNLATLADDVGLLEEARRYYEQALAIFEEVGVEEDARSVRANLADLAVRLAKGVSAPMSAVPAPISPATVPLMLARDAPPRERLVPESGRAGELQRRRWWPFRR
jgi:tetratricopeptide (TPR) repeat protein